MGGVFRTIGRGAATLLAVLPAIWEGGRGTLRRYRIGEIRYAASLRLASSAASTCYQVLKVLMQTRLAPSLGRAVGLNALV